MLEWLDLNNHQWNWNAGLNTPACSSSPLCRLSVSFCWSVGTVPGSDQSLALIHSEWSRRGDTGLCDYWTLSLYQFQSFNHSRMSCPAQGARYARSDHRGDRHMGAIDHERYLCIFHGLGIYFMIKSATGSNVLIVFKELGMRAERDSLLCKKKGKKNWTAKGLSKWDKYMEGS